MRQVGSSCGEAFLGVTTEWSVRPPRTLSSGGLASAGCVGPDSAGCASARTVMAHKVMAHEIMAQEIMAQEINMREIDRRLAMDRCTLCVLAAYRFLRMIPAFVAA